jgi:hypothetical protein
MAPVIGVPTLPMFPEMVAVPVIEILLAFVRDALSQLVDPVHDTELPDKVPVPESVQVFACAFREERQKIADSRTRFSDFMECS